MSNFCVMVSRCTEMLDSNGTEGYGEWERCAVETRTCWYSPNGRDWTEGETETLLHLEGSANPSPLREEDTESMDSAMRQYQGEYEVSVAYWFVDSAGIQRGADASDISNLPDEVISALRDVECPSSDERDLIRHLSEIGEYAA